MAKKKQSKRDEYADILGASGLDIAKFDILGFVFDDADFAAERFHYALMASGAKYEIFDCFSEYANVVVPKDASNAAVIVELAVKEGGKKITPML